MVQTLLRQRVAQGLHDMLLPHHFGEVAGTVFAGEHEIRHGAGFYGLHAGHHPHRRFIFAPAYRGPQQAL